MLIEKIEDLTFDEKCIAGGWFGMMVPDKGELTFQLETSKPTARAQDALDGLVRKGLVSVEAFNHYGGLVYKPLVRFSECFEWLGANREKPEVKFKITEPVLGRADAKSHQQSALKAQGPNT